ncbi:MAG: hypothetical protein ACK5KQ_00010 [Anaerorhabdus sp.]
MKLLSDGTYLSEDTRASLFHQYVSSCAKAGGIGGMAVGSTAGWMVETAWDAADVIRAVLSKDEMGMAVGLFSLFMSQDDIIRRAKHIDEVGDGLLKGSALDDVIKKTGWSEEQIDDFLKNNNMPINDLDNAITNKGWDELLKEINPNTRLPKSNGNWVGEPGNGTWFSDNPKVNTITGGEGIKFVGGRPDFLNLESRSTYI